jgi:hypothetical protein
MKVLIVALCIVGAYAFALLLTTNMALTSVQSYQAVNEQVADTADQWTEGNTSVSFVPGT